MADEKLTALTALDAFATGDLLYTVDDPAGTPASKKATIDQAKTFIVGAGSVSIASGKTLTGSNTLTLAGTDGTTMTFPATSATLARTDAGNTFTGAQTFSVGTVNGTGLNLTQTWSGTGTYTGLQYNVTDNGPSNAASLLMDLQRGGVSQFSVRRDGLIKGSGNSTITIATDITITNPNSTRPVNIDGYLNVTSGVGIGQTAGQTLNSADLLLTRRGTANLRLGAADTAGSAISVSSVASNQLTLASNHGLTNGAAVQVTFTAGGAVPAGTAVNTTYYARSISAAVLELYGTFDQAITTASTTGIIAVTTAGTTAFINRATPFQTLSVQSFTGTDIPGQPFVITGSQGTGTGAGGDIIFQVAPRGTTGSTANALATALRINGSGNLLLPGGSTSSVALQFSNSDLGFAGILGGNNLGIVRIGTSTAVFRVDINGAVGATRSFGIGASAGSEDVILIRDLAATLALRNANNGQTFRVYGRFTDITNDFERFFITAPTTSGAAVQLGTQKGATTGAARALEFQTDGTTALTITPARVVTAGNIQAQDGYLGLYDTVNDAIASTVTKRTFIFNTGSSAFMQMNSGAYFGFSSAAYGADAIANADVRVIRDAVGILGVRGTSTSVGAALSLIEQTAPAAPAANGVRIYAEDNGSGKTRLMALFATGAAQQIAIEP